MKKSEKGSVLIFVLVTSVVIAIIAAGLTRMMIMRAYASQRLQESNVNKKKAEAGINLVTSGWNAAGPGNSVCAPVAGYACTAGLCTPGTCDCTMTVNPPDSTQATVVAAVQNGNCTISATTPP